nr:PilN domain-containing protein [Aquabacterium terrae]
MINLLPHREEKRRQRKRAFFVGLGTAGVAGIAAAGIWMLVLQHLTTVQQSRNEFLTAEIKRLDAQIKDIAELRAEIEGLKARQKAVEDLQTNRNVPVYLLDELVRYTPEGIYFTSIKQVGEVVTLTGVAQTNERVSELLRNTTNQSQWLKKPELIEIKAVNVPAGQAANRDQRRLHDFSIRVSLIQPGAQAAPAASAPASAAARKAS